MAFASALSSFARAKSSCERLPHSERRVPQPAERLPKEYPNLLYRLSAVHSRLPLLVLLPLWAQEQMTYS